MSQLFIRRGMTKTAAEEDGPSFEQQFGILANAVITEKFPQLDNMKLAFQLIEKNDDNSEAVGAMVYMVGQTVVFVPAFFKNQKLRTGDMMFVAQNQQFLPLDDPWLAWIRDKDLRTVGENVGPDTGTDGATADSTLVREYADPITKTAALYLKALLHAPFSVEEDKAGASLLDTALALGKTASEHLCDALVKNANMLNAALTFYSGDDLNEFAKKAAAMAEEPKGVELIMPFTKEAEQLGPAEREKLERDGYLVRSDGKSAPDVMRVPQVRNMFGNITEAGTVQLLGMDGSLHDVLILADACLETEDCPCCCEGCCGDGKAGDPGVTAKKYMRGDNIHGYVCISGGNAVRLDPAVMVLLPSKEQFRPSMLDDVGKPLGSVNELRWHDWLLFPDGTCTSGIGRRDKVSEGHWASPHSNGQLIISDNDDMTSAVQCGDMLVVPKGTRVISVPDEKPMALPCSPVTIDNFDAFLTEFCKRHYDKARVYSNGSQIQVSGDKTASVTDAGRGEAAHQLVRDYGVSPDDAGAMLSVACAGATDDSPKSTLFYISKTASDPMWQDAALPMSEHIDRPPQTDYMQMPSSLESPEQLQAAMENAARNGIKEVFDVTALKLLVRQTRFFDEIQEDMPLFMRTLDSLCRKLFQFYWHTDKMEEKYGMVKMKALEESLKTTIDSLSELTIFFKLRTVDGSGSTRDSLGDLMDGKML